MERDGREQRRRVMISSIVDTTRKWIARVVRVGWSVRKVWQLWVGNGVGVCEFYIAATPAPTTLSINLYR